MATPAAAPGPLPEHEIKLVTPAVRAPLIDAWLRARCRPDPLYPHGLVTSVYFDNREAVLLRAKINSDFIKYKVRLRWYADPDSGELLGPPFAEIKRKVGARRFKTRLALDARLLRVLAAGPSASELRRALEPLRAAGHWVDADLQPLLRISFRRRRHIEPDSGARVSVDADIRGASVNPGLLPRRHPAPLAHAVIEIKGPYAELPRRLLPLRELGCRPESFSKYLRCYQKITRRSSF